MSKSVLIVDDSDSIRQLVGMVLKREGFNVAEADNGKSALKKLDGTKFNLIISDLNMPQMNGIEFLKAVKADSRY
jgi:two-component system chemotaxis response regulator CheY